MKQHYKFLILGAGPTGLGAAYRLKELGIEDFLILESENHAGGLAASFTDTQGFVWDVGGHVHFSHYKYYDEALDKVLGKDAWLSHVRNSQIWLEDGFVPYPFQNNLHHLPALKKWRCLLGLLFAAFKKGKGQPQNFEAWIENSFGSGIADIFLFPYNKKVWAHPLSGIDTKWMGDRIAPVNFLSILKNTLLNRDASSWGPNSMFRFPKFGGTGAIWRAMASYIGESHVQMNSSVDRVDATRKTVLCGGKTLSYEALISSIPIQQLVSISDGVSVETKDSAKKLKHSSTHLVGLGLEGSPPEFIKKIGWMYFPDQNIPYYRATILSNHSPHCVPNSERMWSLLLEISESDHWNNGLQDVMQKTENALRRTNFIQSQTRILSRWYKKIFYGYPTPHLGRDEILNRVQPELERHHIYSRGRFGGWKYEAGNQDHSFMQGVEVVNRLVKSEPEVTYPTPHIANQRQK